MGRVHAERGQGGVEFTYRPELANVNRTLGLPDGPELEELMAAEMIKEEAPGWDEFMPRKVKEERVESTYRPELADVNRTRGLPDKAKEELLEQGTALPDARIEAN